MGVSQNEKDIDLKGVKVNCACAMCVLPTEDSRIIHLAVQLFIQRPITKENSPGKANKPRKTKIKCFYHGIHGKQTLFMIFLSSVYSVYSVVNKP